MKSSEILIVGLVLTILERFEEMEKKLLDAISDLNTEVEDESTKLASIQTYVHGVPGIVAAAVAEALANVGVEETAAAEQIEAAKQKAADSVSATLAAVDANTPASDTGTSGAAADTTGAAPDGGTVTGTDGPSGGGTESPVDQGTGGGADTGTTGGEPAPASPGADQGTGDQPIVE